VASKVEYRPDLPISRIDVWAEANARHRKISADLEQLKQSIKLYGLQQPIYVKKEGGRFRLITGQRRYLACRELGHKDIKAFVMKGDVDLTEAKVLSASENLIRRDLDAKDKADVCMYLYEELGKVGKVAERLGVSYAFVRKYLGFYAAPKKVKERAKELNLSTYDVSQIGTYVDDEAKAIRIAEEMAKLPPPAKDRVVDRLRIDHDKPISEILERAEKAKYREPIVVHFPDEYADALKEACESERKEAETLIKDVVVDWLTERGYVKVAEP
jgi:ParB family chromosome partitioning protein